MSIRKAPRNVMPQVAQNSYIHPFIGYLHKFVLSGFWRQSCGPCVVPLMLESVRNNFLNGNANSIRRGWLSWSQSEMALGHSIWLPATATMWTCWHLTWVCCSTNTRSLPEAFLHKVNVLTWNYLLSPRSFKSWRSIGKWLIFKQPSRKPKSLNFFIG